MYGDVTRRLGDLDRVLAFWTGAGLASEFITDVESCSAFGANNGNCHGEALLEKVSETASGERTAFLGTGFQIVLKT